MPVPSLTGGTVLCAGALITFALAMFLWAMLSPGSLTSTPSPPEAPFPP